MLFLNRRHIQWRFEGRWNPRDPSGHTRFCPSTQDTPSTCIVFHLPRLNAPSTQSYFETPTELVDLIDEHHRVGASRGLQAPPEFPARFECPGTERTGGREWAKWKEETGRRRPRDSSVAVCVLHVHCGHARFAAVKSVTTNGIPDALEIAGSLAA